MIKAHAAGTHAGGTEPRVTVAPVPLFVYLAWHLVHSPLEVPPAYLDPKCADDKNRQLYHGMTTALDDGIGNVTRALHEAGMYDTTLIIFYADNGGPLVTTGMSGNNYPLKGGKTDDFEGGTRSVAFISGGFVPARLRGSTHQAYIHAADWYATLCVLAKVDPVDSHAGVPGIDSIDQWPVLLKENATWQDGGRQEMVLAYNNLGSRLPGPAGYDAALIQGRYKVVTGHQGASGFWTGPIHPNATGPADPTRNASACGAFSCCEGCLYDIQRDPTEHNDLRLAMPALYTAMHARLMELANTTYQTDYIQPGLKCLQPEQAKAYYKGFRGPPCFNASQFPVVPTPPPTPAPPVDAFQIASPGGGGCLAGEPLGLDRCQPNKQPAPLWRVSDPATGELEWAASGAVKLGICIKLHEQQGWNCDNIDTNQTSAYTGHCSGAGSSGAHKSNFFYTVPAQAGAGVHVHGGHQRVLVKSHDCPKLCLARLAMGSDGDSDSDVVGGRVGLASCADMAASIVWVHG